MSMFRKAQQASDGVITGYKWDVKKWEPKQKGGDAYHTLSFEFLFLVDGATEPQQRFINAGFFYPNENSVSADGLTLESENEGPIVREDTEFARFISSLVEKGFPEATLDPNGRNFEAIVGGRYQLVNWVDEAATKEFGKRKSKKTGKEYNRTELRIGQVYALPEAGKKTSAKTSAKPATKASTKAAPKPATTERDTDALDSALLDILGANDGNVTRKEISAKVVKHALVKKLDGATRDLLRKELADEAYLVDAAERGIISFDPADKKQAISLPA